MSESKEDLTRSLNMVAATVASPGDGSGQITKSPGISRFKNVFSQTKHDLMEETSLTAALDEPN